MYSLSIRHVFLFMTSIVVGSIAGIFIPANGIITIIIPITNMLTRIILYITIPYFIFSIIINSFELKGLGLFAPIFTFSLLWGFVTIVTLTLISMLVFLLIPFNSSIPFIPDIALDNYIELSSIIETLFPSNFLQVLSSSQTSIAAILIVCCLIGTMAVNNIHRGNVFFDVVDAMRGINLKILRIFLPYFSICICFASSVFSATIIQYEQLQIIGGLFTVLTIILIALLFIVYPFLLRVMGVKISYKLWCIQLIPAVSTALSTTNVLVSASLLLHVEELGYSRKRNNEMSTSFALIFCRAGTALTFALSYLFIYKVYSSIPMNAIFFILVFLGAIISSYLSSMVSGSIFISTIIALSQIPGINIQDLYIILIPVQTVLIGFAAGIDATSCSFMQLFATNRIQQYRNKLQKDGSHNTVVQEILNNEEESLYANNEKVFSQKEEKDTII